MSASLTKFLVWWAVWFYIYIRCSKLMCIMILDHHAALDNSVCLCVKRKNAKEKPWAGESKKNSGTVVLSLQTLQSWYSKYTVKQLAIVDLSKHVQIYSEIKTSSYSWTNRFFQSCIATISELHRRLLQKQTAKATVLMTGLIIGSWLHHELHDTMIASSYE